MVLKLINWLRPSFQDNDGTASHRRLTAFAFASIDAWIVLAGKVNTVIMLNVHYSLLMFIALLIGIITTQNILQFFNKRTNEKITEK